MIKVKRSTIAGMPDFMTSCSPIQREVRYLNRGFSSEPTALTNTIDFTFWDLAASATTRAESMLMLVKAWGRFRRTATRSTTPSMPAQALATAFGSRTSPTTTSAQRTL